jgi:hypothetical protein
MREPAHRGIEPLRGPRRRFPVICCFCVRAQPPTRGWKTALNEASMGVQNVTDAHQGPTVVSFREALLRDLRALEQMLESGMLESDVIRVGIEQEMFLVDGAYRPAPVAAQVLTGLSDSAFTNEIGKFNLEANMQPRVLEGGCLRSIETELTDMLQRASTVARQHGADVLLTGILPSVRLRDLTLQNLTEKPRYEELNRAVMDVRGGSYHLLIKGVEQGCPCPYRS